MKKRQSPADNPPVENDPARQSGKTEGPSDIPDQIAQESAVDEDLLAETRRALLVEQSTAGSKIGILQKVKNRLKTSRGQKTDENSEKVATTASTTAAKGDETEGAHLASEITSQGAAGTADEAALDAEIQSLLDALDTADKGKTEKTSEVEKPSARDHKPTENVIETAHQVLASKPEKDEKLDFRELRDIALEDYQEPVPEVIVVPRPTVKDRVGSLKKRINYRALIRITTTSLAILVILAVFFVGFYIVKTQPSILTRPTIAPTEFVPTASPPSPLQIRFPGGWAFVLKKGSTTNGKWTPTGPEWLEGTEICKWVSLPSSDQLEAVTKTLKPGDRIELVMTNYDHWLYQVQSISEVNANQMTSLDKNYPSLLVMLTRKNSDIRLVILAVP